jgi:hypothetical protein
MIAASSPPTSPARTRFDIVALATGVLFAVLGVRAGDDLWRTDQQATALLTIAALLAVAPYVALLVQYGSPTPRTPGQIAMIKSGALAVGWDSAERMTPASYAVHFLSEFVLEWMPILKPRNALNYAALAIPITAALCGWLVLICVKDHFC